MQLALARTIGPAARSSFIPIRNGVVKRVSLPSANGKRGFHSSLPNLGEIDDVSSSGYQRPVVQWYPGHIAKAERLLKETFKAVDVVVEVRDARAAKATSHPMVGNWCAGRPRLVVLTHVDAIPANSRKAWLAAYDQFGAEHPDQADTVDRQIQNQARQAARERIKYSMPETSKSRKTKINKNGGDASTVEDVLFVNAKQGAGIHALTRAIFKAGSHVQERRERRGLKERPLRVGVIGYPNVGKSALINRLLGRRRARTANTPGVTRALQWIRVRTDDSKTKRGKEFELLDSPGIIPATIVDQSDATLLAACNCIGDAAYDNQAVAAYLCEWLMSLYRLGYGKMSAPDWHANCKSRYGVDPLQDKLLDDGTGVPKTGEDVLFEVADNTCQGNPEDAARKILQDFRAQRMGLVCLQVAPVSDGDQGQRDIMEHTRSRKEEMDRERLQEEQLQRATAAMGKARERGLQLPPMLNDPSDGAILDGKKSQSSEVGKGLFDGW
jgi:ribosome biogenesis GTPase A